MSEPAWVPLGGAVGNAPYTKSVVPFVMAEDGFPYGVQWPDGSLKHVWVFLPVPSDWAGGAIPFKIARRAQAAAGTAVMRLDAYRARDGVAITALTSQQNINFGPGHTNSAIQPLYTFDPANFQAGDVLLLALQRLGADASDTMAAGVSFDGAWCEYAAYPAGSGTVPGQANVVTTLPGSAADGQEVILCDSLTAPTYTWHLRYVEAKASNKWVYLGGVPLLNERNVTGTRTSNAYGDLNDAANVPAITIPVAGDYHVEIGAYMEMGALALAYMSFAIGATAAADAEAAITIGNSINEGGTVYRKQRKNALPAGAVLAAKYRSTGGLLTSYNRMICATPVAIGG